jgi:hypothetical protein
VLVNNIVISNAPGEWLNYTRQFPAPAQDYYVLARIASGGNPIRFQMDEVTAGVASTNQTLRRLGEFNPGRATAGWDHFEFFPLVGATNQLIVLEDWIGEKTFRMTMLTNSAQDLDYFVFVPLGGGVTPGKKFTSFTRSGDNLVLTWNEGILESADSVNGPWTPVPNATSPFTVTITGPGKFYRLR